MTNTVTHPQGRPSASLHFAVGEMSGKLDQLMASLLPQLEALRAEDSSLASRLTSVESFQWRMAGGGGVIIFIISAWEIIRVLILN